MSCGFAIYIFLCHSWHDIGLCHYYRMGQNLGLFYIKLILSFSEFVSRDYSAFFTEIAESVSILFEFYGSAVI